YPNAAKPRDQFRLGEDVMQMARLESGQPGGSSIATLR
ncbi:MAG: hypothetical protein RLZZ366_1982, partial [Pseudomonadota bacterium]